jgi:hypothetical protein
MGNKVASKYYMAPPRRLGGDPALETARVKLKKINGVAASKEPWERETCTSTSTGARQRAQLSAILLSSLRALSRAAELSPKLNAPFKLVANY